MVEHWAKSYYNNSVICCLQPFFSELPSPRQFPFTSLEYVTIRHLFYTHKKQHSPLKLIVSSLLLERGTFSTSRCTGNRGPRENKRWGRIEEQITKNISCMRGRNTLNCKQEQVIDTEIPSTKLSRKPVNTLANDSANCYDWLINNSEIQNIFFVFLSSCRNTRGSLGEWEMLWEHEPQASVSTAFSSCPKLSRVFL